ncbi:MAG: VTT domain-containing protein [Caldimicrobium sp.]|nr:VTT domain-containing protein [Caldimicrobium sp.]
MVETLVNLWNDREFLRKIAEENPYLGALLYVFFQALQIVVAPLPGEAGFVAGFIFGAKLGFILHLTGTAIGSSLAYLIARVFRKRFENRLKDNRLLLKVKRLVERGGLFGLFLAYLIPGFPKDVLNYVLGLLKVSYPSFITANVLGRAPISFLMALQGDLVYEGNPKKILIALGFTLLVFLIFFFLKKRLERELFLS